MSDRTYEEVLLDTVGKIFGRDPYRDRRLHPLSGLIFTDTASGTVIACHEVRPEADRAIRERKGTIETMSLGGIDPSGDGKSLVRIVAINGCAIAPGIGTDDMTRCMIILDEGVLVQLAGIRSGNPARWRHVLGLMTLEDLQADSLGR